MPETFSTACPVYWPRAIILMDMNAFFASIEQRDFPSLQNKPVAITNGEAGSTIITCSYEARAFGIHTGMSIYRARELCPHVIQRSTRPKEYARVSIAIMRALEDISPDIEVFSVDEAFLDVTHCQKLHGTPLRMGRMVKQKVVEVSGLPCSVGISSDKTTAKFAAKLVKPDGLTIIPPWEARERLQHEPTTALCGIAEGIGSFLAQHGAYHCGDVGKLPISVLARRFGNLGRRIWLMCQGEDPDKIHMEVAAPKSLGHGKVVPPGTCKQNIILTYLLHMSEKVAARLRKHRLEARHYFIGLRLQGGWIGDKLRLATPSNNGDAIFRLCNFIVEHHWHGEVIKQVQVTALDPQPVRQQMELFDEHDSLQNKNLDNTQGKVDKKARQEIAEAMDQVNQRYGEFTLAPARLLNRSSMPNVIAPAWKPDGHRKTV